MRQRSTSTTWSIRSLNSLAPGRFKINFRWVIFKLILVVNGWGIFYETDLIWLSLSHTYDKSTLVQVMTWCRHATSHYLSQCWPKSQSPYGVTRPQCVNGIQSPHFNSLISCWLGNYICFTECQIRMSQYEHTCFEFLIKYLHISLQQY